MPVTLRAVIFLAGGAAVYGAAAMLTGLRLPPFPATLVALAVALGLWHVADRSHALRRERRAKGLCVRCGYDMRGSLSGVCPECGQAT